MFIDHDIHCGMYNSSRIEDLAEFHARRGTRSSVQARPEELKARHLVLAGAVWWLIFWGVPFVWEVLFTRLPAGVATLISSALHAPLVIVVPVGLFLCTCLMVGFWRLRRNHCNIAGLILVGLSLTTMAALLISAGRDWDFVTWCAFFAVIPTGAEGFSLLERGGVLSAQTN